jgi:hypothetical protein
MVPVPSRFRCDFLHPDPSSGKDLTLFRACEWQQPAKGDRDVITRDEVMPLLLAACPSFRPVWQQVAAENYDDEGRCRLHYLDAGDVARHLVELQRAGATAEILAAMRVVERLHVEGDDYVRELATIGYLEGIQFAASHVPDVDEADFRAYLGPESRRWWDGLVAFWDGSVPPPVRPVD